MMSISKKLLGTVLIGGVVLSLGTPAFATDPYEPPIETKCNSGRGNGFEPTLLLKDCDPGNSGDHNNGGG